MPQVRWSTQQKKKTPAHQNLQPSSGRRDRSPPLMKGHSTPNAAPKDQTRATTKEQETSPATTTRHPARPETRTAKQDQARPRDREKRQGTPQRSARVASVSYREILTVNESATADPYNPSEVQEEVAESEEPPVVFPFSNINGRLYRKQISTACEHLEKRNRCNRHQGCCSNLPIDEAYGSVFCQRRKHKSQGRVHL